MIFLFTCFVKNAKIIKKSFRRAWGYPEITIQGHSRESGNP